MRDTAKIIERLNKDMEELELHKAGLVPNEEAMAKLETLIQITKEALKDMGLDIEVHNLDNLGKEAAQLKDQHDTLLWEVEVAIGHLQFVETIINLFKSRMPILPVRPPVHLGSDNSYVQLEKDPMEGIFGSPVDEIAHSQAGSSRKLNIDSMCGGCGDKNASQKQAGEDTSDQQKAEERVEKRADVVGAQGDASKESAEVPLKPKLAMNKDIEDAKKSSEKPIEKDTTVNLSDEDADLLISDVCGEMLGCRKKRSNTEEHATPKKKDKVAFKPPEPTPRVELIFSPVSPAKWTVVAIEAHEINEMEINSLEEPDEKVEDIAAKQDADVTPDKVEENQELAVCLEIEETLPNCRGWVYLVSNFCKIKKLIILDLNGLFVKRDVSKRDPKTGQFEHPPRPASDRVKLVLLLTLS
ncbi:hypothetical protein L7F22_062191 [Adiantum nelumboides]|nr:hypothetical protein [Adiantum nelumboides]